MKFSLKRTYGLVLAHFGPQHWWPGDSAFEISVGAILTQNTSWANVSKAIDNLKAAGLMEPERLYAAGFARTSRLIRPSGYYRLKTKRLRSFISYVLDRYGGSFARMKKIRTGRLREELLSINGIGPETADSILLYALGKPVFVVDAYTKRVFARHGFIAQTAGYQDIQSACMKVLPCEAGMFNEYHALIVKLGKVCCLKNNPKCGQCPLKNEK